MMVAARANPASTFVYYYKDSSMASVLYPLWKEGMMSAAANTSVNQPDATNGPYASLIDEGTYTYSAGHQFYSSAAGSAVGPASGVQLTAPTVTAGTFDAADVTFTAVTGNSVEALIIYRHNSGANTTWYLVALLESDYITGLPVTPNGGDILVQFHVSGIFTL
jgi:hypothetical protein